MPGKDGVEIIPNLLDVQFKLNNPEIRVEILKQGRPKFHLTNIKKEKSRNSSVAFNDSWYDEFSWLCGSASLNKLFCWPCLLMRPDTSSWCSTGIDDFVKFSNLALKHVKSKYHYKAITEYDGTLLEAGMLPQFTAEAEQNKGDMKGSDSDSDHIGRYLAPKAPPPPSAQTANTPFPGSERRTLTFQAWQQANNALLNCNDHKLNRRRRRLARLEIKNARLTAQKLQLEIKLLESQLELQQSLNTEPSTRDPQASSDAP